MESIENKKPKHDTEIILISNKSNSNVYIDKGLLFLDDYGKIEFHALENNIPVAITCSENLVRNNFAV